MALVPPNPLLNVVHEDEDLLVVNKPAGLVCHPTKGDVYSSLISRVRLYFAGRFEAHLINRLDRETSGLVVVAKTGGVTAQLRRCWENREVGKEYVAIVHGRVAQDQQVIDAPLGKDLQSAVAIKDCVRSDGVSARTEIFCLTRFVRPEGEFSLMRVVPQTGRKHQIRIHLAHIGHPIVGDKIYGSDERYYLDLVEGRLTDQQRKELLLPFHALHAEGLQFDLGGSSRKFHVQPESWFADFLSLPNSDCSIRQA